MKIYANSKCSFSMSIKNKDPYRNIIANIGKSCWKMHYLIVL